MPIQMIALDQLHDHPNNPRLTPREDIIEQIASQLNSHMDEAHALIVRPIDEGYQIISGHHRKLAALKVGLAEVPCWVREMDDNEAYMQLVLQNAQGELHSFEIGRHALKSGLGPSEYARRTGAKQSITSYRVCAARVAEQVNDLSLTEARDVWLQLVEIHAAKEWLRPVLVQHLLAEGWSVKQVKSQVDALKNIQDPPPWVDLDGITAALMDGTMKSSDVAKFASTVAKAQKELTDQELDAPELLVSLDQRLQDLRPCKPSQVSALCNDILQQQATRIHLAREAEMAAQRAAEEAAARVVRLHSYVSLEEWNTLSPEEQHELLHLPEQKGPTFNKQDSRAIEWAQYSWNPISGCLHSCSYCYARDISLDPKFKTAFPYGFEPTLRPLSLLAPRLTRPPKEAMFDTRYKNVFTGSMADIWGRWVPQAWIEAILDSVRAAPDWNFLFLTKFPTRMAEFEYPENAWLGTTVDLQVRVDAAEKAFAKVNAPIKWLSIEPMLEPLQFTRLDLFNWIVLGGASPQSKTPTWKPPFIWIYDLMKQAEAAGVPVYAKSNLLGSPARDGLLNLPDYLPVTPEETVLPEVFRYLKGA
jgi:protein gp37/ParB-like chromosome segregation protein Spo0J